MTRGLRMLFSNIRTELQTVKYQGSIAKREADGSGSIIYIFVFFGLDRIKSCWTLLVLLLNPREGYHDMGLCDSLSKLLPMPMEISFNIFLNSHHLFTKDDIIISVNNALSQGRWKIIFRINQNVCYLDLQLYPS